MNFMLSRATARSLIRRQGSARSSLFTPSIVGENSRSITNISTSPSCLLRATAAAAVSSVSFNSLLLSPSLTSSSSSSASSFSTLSNLLEREIKEEAENSLNEMPPDLSQLKQTLSDKWTIIDGGSATSDDGATVKMFKKDGSGSGAKVTVSFHCQDSLDAEELGFFDQLTAGVEGEGDNSNEDGEEEEEERSSPVKFDVQVSRVGKVMHIACLSENAEASIEGIMISESDDNSLEEDGELYRGPNLEDLPEDVKDALDDFLLMECGVDEDVAAFIAMYADYREQMEYINWLGNVKKVVG